MCFFVLAVRVQGLGDQWLGERKQRGVYSLWGVCMGALSDCAIPLRSGSSEQRGIDMEMGSMAQHASVPPSPERWGVESQSTNRYLITPFCPLPHEPMLRWSIHRRWHTEKKLRAGGLTPEFDR